MKKRVSAHGPQSARIVIVSDYPDPKELLAGDVLSGYAQYYIKRLFSGTSIKYNDLYYTSILKEGVVFPRKMNDKAAASFIAKNRDLKPAIQLLCEEINSIKPNVIVPLGETALQLLTGNSGIRQLMGSILRPLGSLLISQNIKVIPILHPRNLIVEYSMIFPTTVYVERIVKYADIAGFPEQDYSIRVIKNATQLHQYIDSVRGNKLRVTDIETYGNHITAMGFCCDGHLGVSVPLLDSRIHHLELALMYRQIAEFLANNEWVNQNIAFDEKQCNYWGFRYGKVVGDTMLAAGTIYPELDKNLGFLNTLYTEMPYFKDEGKEFDPSKNEKLYEYNAKDCISTWRIWREQCKEMRELNLWDFYQKGTMKWFHMYSKLERRGILIDEEARAKLNAKYDEKRSITVETIKAALNRDNFNPSSNKQCCELLYDDLDLPIQKKKRADGTVTPTADADALEYLALNKVDDPIVKDLLLCIILVRKIDKIKQFINSIKHPDGRLKTRYKIAGPETGRTSTSQSDDLFYYFEGNKIKRKHYGFSGQQFPKHGYVLIGGERIGDDLREMFIPSPGYQFIDWDQAQAEAVVVGALARDMDMLDVIRRGDLHRWTAALVTGKTQVEVTPDERQVQGKKTRHGGHYDMTYKTLSQQAKISERDAKIALTKFHQKSPNIRGVFQAEIRDKVNKFRYLITPHGRRRDFFGRMDQNLFREAYSYIPQAVVSDKQKFGMLSIEEESKDIRMLLESHDGTLAEIPIGSAEHHFKIIKKIMLEKVKFETGSFVRDPVEIGIELGLSDSHWGAMEKVDY